MSRMLDGSDFLLTGSSAAHYFMVRPWGKSTNTYSRKYATHAEADALIDRLHELDERLEVVEYNEYGKVVDRPSRCPNCKGKGYEGRGDLEADYPCRTCFGLGTK